MVFMVFMVTTHDAARRCTGGAPDSSISIVTGQGDGDGSNYSGSRHGYMLASPRRVCNYVRWWLCSSPCRLVPLSSDSAFRWRCRRSPLRVRCQLRSAAS